MHELDDLLDQVARLARSDCPPQAFHLEMLDRAVRALAAAGGAVWIRPPAGAWEIDSRVDLSASRLVETLSEQPAHQDLLEAVSHSGQSRIVLPRAGSATGPFPNPTDFLLLVCPLALGDDGPGAGVLEVAQRPGAAPSSQQGCLRLLEALCELAADFHRRRRLRVLQAMAAKTQLADKFTLAAHASLDLAATACAIANEGRRLIECDRLSVAVRRGNTFRLLSVSGLETLDRRSSLVQRLEALTSVVVAAGEPFWFSGNAEPLAPQIAAPLHAWQDESHARSLAIIPLKTGTAPGVAAEAALAGAALIAERFAGGGPDEAYRHRVSAVCRHAELALQNALEHENLPFFRLVRALQRSRWFVEARRLPKTVAVAAGAAAAVAVLAFVPADFEIESRGVLQPRNRRDVFARSDGIVSEVRTEHARECREGEILVVMTRSQLDFEMSRVLGELQTARKRLASVQAARLDVNPRTAADREKYNQLTAEEEEVRELLKSLDQQHAVLTAQREDLFVRSPLTGQVVTWNVRQSLEARPVQRGQVLLQVADLGGPWVVEAEVPDDRVGHVLAARQTLQRDLPVSFMIATEPGAVYRGAIEKVALATDVRPPEKASVLVTVAIDREQILQLRPNATVVSRIYCGRRSIGFVWFHSFWEMIQKKVLF
ncbi:MAG: HlyD family efflux transporter periplasmic adaptor subunit [Deltaproteobacteria bacterium]